MSMKTCTRWTCRTGRAGGNWVARHPQILLTVLTFLSSFGPKPVRKHAQHVVAAVTLVSAAIRLVRRARGGHGDVTHEA